MAKRIRITGTMKRDGKLFAVILETDSDSDLPSQLHVLAEVTCPEQARAVIRKALLDE